MEDCEIVLDKFSDLIELSAGVLRADCFIVEVDMW
jgi:hypothetical protein